MKLPPEYDPESTGPAKAILITVLFLAAMLLASALLSGCTCTLNGEEAAKSIIHIYRATK